MPTCLTAFALVWNTLPQDTCLTSYLRILTSLLKSHVTTEYCCLCLDFPKSRAWNKSLNACGFGRKLIPRKGVRRKDWKLNQGYLSDLIKLSLARLLCGSWRMCPRIIHSDEEKASMYIPLPSPFSQRLLKGMLLPLIKWAHAFTSLQVSFMHVC